MPIATGLFKQVSIKKEVTFGVAPASTLFTPLRRVQSNIDVSKDAYQSNEMLTHQQIQDFRHGVRRVQGNISGELAPGAYSAIFEGILKRDWSTGVSVALAATTLTVAGAGPTFTLTRSGGSWITDGFKISDVVRITAGGTQASNRDKNLLIVALTATIATVLVLNGSGLVSDATQANCTVAVTGRKTWVPAASHTDNSYAIEHWHPDAPANELFLGCKFSKADIALPATGMSTVSFDVLGQSVTNAGTRYATTFTALNSAGLTAAVNGALIVGGTALAIVTGLQVSIAPTFTGDPVVGSNVLPALYPGRVNVSGQFTAYFDNTTLRDLFLNETETSLVVALTSDNTANSKFVTLSLPRIKLNGANKADAEGGIVQTIPFQALYNAAGGANTTSEQSTIVMQDSDA